ncbi:hypothetical protein HPB50_014756 [Hyalomma asiaticum]|uniref:Uncharacterized protein n=1 Tax=Hyalomma asiaticum TaxID=266040 RepID=A0ACB7TKU1_HYAAI|nr:hypothetical protein HPB50_014756 [Hyalomma asiaticum]
MDPSVQKLHGGFGRLQPNCHASEGDSTKMVGLEGQSIFQTLTLDDHMFPEVAGVGESLTPLTTDEFDRAITTFQGLYGMSTSLRHLTVSGDVHNHQMRLQPIKSQYYKVL